MDEPEDESIHTEIRADIRERIPQPSTRDSEACDFCRMPIPEQSVEATVDGRRYHFCTVACRDELRRTTAVFTEYHGFRRIDPDVEGLDRALPQGIPRNSFVLLSGDAGTREDTLGAELIWRTLERGEPAVLVTFTEPPISVIQRFLDMRWNVLPALESDHLRIVDCFTSRIAEPDRFRKRLNDWNQHLLTLTDPQTVTVEDASATTEIRNKIDNSIGGLEMVDRGVVHIDSLTEFGTLVQPVQAYDFIKNLRANVCKGRFVPIFGGATRHNEELDEFPHDLSYVLDGIIELDLSGSVIEDTLLRRLRVRKMNGVLAITEWKAYEFTAERGLVIFDPIEEIAKHRSELDDESDVA